MQIKFNHVFDFTKYLDTEIESLIQEQYELFQIVPNNFLTAMYDLTIVIIWFTQLL